MADGTAINISTRIGALSTMPTTAQAIAAWHLTLELAGDGHIVDIGHEIAAALDPAAADQLLRWIIFFACMNQPRHCGA